MEGICKLKHFKDINIIYSINFTQIIILFVIIQEISLANTIYFPGSTTLNRLMKVHDAKQLRIDLIEHKSYLEDIIKHLDEWAFEEIKEITNNEEISNIKLKWLEKHLNKSRDDIKTLQSDFAENLSNISNIKERYNNIQNNLQNLSDYFVEQNLDTFRLLKEYIGNTLPNLFELYENLLYKMSVLFRQIDAQERTILINECIDAIKEKQFEKAVYTFNLINDNNILTYIVKEAYNKDENNFNLILNFGNKFRNITKSFLVYTVLIYEMEINGQNKDGLKIIEIIKNLKNEIIVQLKTINTTKNEALALEEFLIKKLKVLGKDILKNTILDDKLYFNIAFFEQILLLDEKVFSEITFEVLYDLSYDPKFNPIFEWIIQYTFNDIFEKIFVNNLNDKYIFKLGYYIEDLLLLANMENSNKNLSVILNKNMEYYKKRLPESVRNIIFTNNICIKNIGIDEYLYTTNNTNKYTVFTRKSNIDNVRPEEQWKLTHIHGNVYSIQQNYTYLYTSDIDDNDEHKSNGHNVFTWLQQNNNNDDFSHINFGIWEIVPNDDYCYIKNNLHFDEYLYVSEETSHIVFTVNTTNKNVNNSKWLIVNCTNV